MLATHLFWATLLASKPLGVGCPSLTTPFDVYGPSIRGSLQADLIAGNPRPYVSLRLLSADKTVWRGRSDEHGDFEIKSLLPGRYRLLVTGWGSLEVHVHAQRFYGSGQTLQLYLRLFGRGCSYVSGSMN